MSTKRFFQNLLAQCMNYLAPITLKEILQKIVRNANHDAGLIKEVKVLPVYSCDEDTNLLEMLNLEFDTKSDNPVLKQLLDVYSKTPIPPAEDADEIFRKMKETIKA